MYKGNIILFVLCLFAIAAGIAVYFEASAFQKKAKITEGIVDNTRISSYNVKYTSDDGVEHTLRISGKNRRHTGDKLTVFYRADKTNKARITDGKKGGKKIIIIAIVMILLNLFFVYKNKARTESAMRFKTTGRKVTADVVGITNDMEITIKEMHPYLVHCKWVDPMTAREYTHTIRYIWQDPAPLLAQRNGIDVYIDREDPEKYFMDTEFLGEIAR